MDPIAAQFGPVTVYGFTAWLSLGLLAGLGLVTWLNRPAAVSTWIDPVLAAAAGALLGGRVLYVLLHADYFRIHPNEAWQIWRGGLVYHGALLGGILALAFWSRITHKPFWPIAGALAPGLAVLLAFGWLACRADDCAFGREIPIGGVPLVALVAAERPNNLGIITLRYRTQAAGALGSMLVAASVLFVARRKKTNHAVVALAALAGISLVRVVVAPFRGDSVPLWNGIRLDLLVDAGLALACGAAALLTYWLDKRAGNGSA